MAATTGFTDFVEQIRPRIDAALKAYTDFSSAANDLGHVCPETLREAMRYSLLAPGKRLRPMLALFAAQACSQEIDVAMPAACAVEMVHAYSLIHDDLPAMDDDDLRRGKPTCHKVYGEATAILTGDALLALAFEVTAGGIHPPEAAARCCRVLAKTAGATALVGGQIDDLAAEGTISIANSPQVVSLEHLHSIHARKTAAMLVASVEMGGICANGDGEQLAALRRYAQRLGLAFQIKDDLLDVVGEESSLGKRIGKDSPRGKLTYPSLLGVDESRRRAAHLIDEACGALALFGPKGTGLGELARYVVERDR